MEAFVVVVALISAYLGYLYGRNKFKKASTEPVPGKGGSGDGSQERR